MTMPPRNRVSLTLIIRFLFCILAGCAGTEKKNSAPPVRIDFAAPAIPVSPDSSGHSSLRVAVSSMISPKETFSYYDELMRYIASRVGKPIEFKQRKTYKDVNLLLETGEVDLAFICSGAYVEEADKSSIEIIAVPVTNGKPLYQAYVITHALSGIERFEDFRGRSFAFTDPLSNTGYLYAVKRAKQMNSSVERFFGKSFYTYAHDNSIQLVAKRTVDGATIDGLIFDYLERFAPERVRGLRIIERSEYYGIPPIVVPKSLPSELKQKLRETLLSIHKDPEGQRILSRLFIDKFTTGRDADYNSIRAVQKFVGQ